MSTEREVLRRKDVSGSGVDAEVTVSRDRYQDIDHVSRSEAFGSVEFSPAAGSAEDSVANRLYHAASDVARARSSGGVPIAAT